MPSKSFVLADLLGAVARLLECQQSVVLSVVKTQVWKCSHQ